MVSAIITTHNRINLLPRAIDSILAQTFKDIECIVVDDASTDGTEDYCKSLDTIRYIRISQNESNGGNYARNLGIKAAKGEYIAFLDDDDVWYPTKIEKQIDAIKARQCGFVYCGKDWEMVNREANETITEKCQSSSLQEGFFAKRILWQFASTSSCFLISKDLLYKVGLFDESLRFWQDYELTIRLAQVTSFHCVKESLVLYRVDATDKNRLTNKYGVWKEAVRYIRKKHSNLYSKLSTDEYVKYLNLVWQDAIWRTNAESHKRTNEYYKVLCYYCRIYEFRNVLKARERIFYYLFLSHSFFVMYRKRLIFETPSLYISCLIMKTINKITRLL